MHLRLNLFSVLGAAICVSGCFGRLRTNGDEPLPPPAPVVLEVQNHNWADDVLDVLHNGVQTRVVQVTAAQDLSLEIPPQLQGEMRVIRIGLRRIGGDDSFVTESVSLRGAS